MKQTAVEWLGLYIKGITTLNCDDIIEQAKEMEKQQIENAYKKGKKYKKPIKDSNPIWLNSKPYKKK
jgi:hypothetical protein